MERQETDAVLWRVPAGKIGPGKGYVLGMREDTDCFLGMPSNGPVGQPQRLGLLSAVFSAMEDNVPYAFKNANGYMVGCIFPVPDGGEWIYRYDTSFQRMKNCDLDVFLARHRNYKPQSVADRFWTRHLPTQMPEMEF